MTAQASTAAGTAIAGIGATEFSKDSGRSELRLAVEAITSALADAGLTAADVDGLVTFTMNGIAEAVRQVRGTSVNQVPGDGPVLVTAGTGVPTSGLILS